MTYVWRTPVSGEQSWTFDQLGNWILAATDGITDTRLHNAQNQVIATSDYTVISYDNKGNLTSQTGETTNVFDAWNRGVSIRGSTFTYDAMGRRVTESDSTDSQYFYYAGLQMIENVPQSGATVRHQQFVYGIDYIDHVILRDRDADNAGDTGSLGNEGSGIEERLYYTHNRQFSVTSLVNQTGTIEERTIYDPYGESQYFSASYSSPTATSSYANNVGFTGRWIDPTGELYFRARYYDPELGRFISQDPIMYVDGMSMYCGYFAVNKVDPTGREIIIIGTDGTKTVIDSGDGHDQEAKLADFLKNAPAGSIASIDLYGHSGPDQQQLGLGDVNQGGIWVSPGGILKLVWHPHDDLIAELNKALSPNGHFGFNGCNSAEAPNKDPKPNSPNSIAQLMSQLLGKGRTVSGFKGFRGVGPNPYTTVKGQRIDYENGQQTGSQGDYWDGKDGGWFHLFTH